METLLIAFAVPAMMFLFYAMCAAIIIAPLHALYLLCTSRSRIRTRRHYGDYQDRYFDFHSDSWQLKTPKSEYRFATKGKQ